MSNKVFNTRIQNKHGTEADWAQATNFTPLLGELIVYDVDENHSMQRIKIGDGVSNVNALPFVNTPDWNAAEGEEGHILNRPFYTEDSEYVLEEIPINGEWDGDTRYDFISPLNLAIGETYIVNWDGVDYTVVGKAYKENNILTCVSLGGESEHPFFIFGESGYNGNDACAYGTKCSFTISRMVNTNILKPTIINFNESVGMIYETLPLNIGDTYIVYWNGIGYPCVAQDLDGAVGLGNGIYDGY